MRAVEEGVRNDLLVQLHERPVCEHLLLEAGVLLLGAVAPVDAIGHEPLGRLVDKTFRFSHGRVS